MTSFAGVSPPFANSRRTRMTSPGSAGAMGSTAILNRTSPVNSSFDTSCMSIASGAAARCVIDADRPSTKNKMAHENPTPSMIPTAVERIPRGLRTWCAQTRLADMGGLPTGDDRTFAQRDHPLQVAGDRGFVGHNDQCRAKVPMSFEQELDDGRRVLLIQCPG